MFSAHLEITPGYQLSFQNFGFASENFPTKDGLVEFSRENTPGASDTAKVVILSICELNKADYHRFWGITPESNKP